MQYCEYIKFILYFNFDFHICLSLKQILRLSILLDCTVKVIKPPHNVQKMSTNCFAAYYLYYKKRSKIIEFASNLFFFNHCQRWYHSLIYYLTVLLKFLLFIICTIKTNLLVIHLRFLFTL